MNHKPLLNAKSAKDLESYFIKPHQSLLISGDDNSNIDDIALWVTDELANTTKTRSEHIFILKPKPKMLRLGVDEVEGVLRRIKYRNAHNSTIITIVRADTLTQEAQNKLLKVFEEPGLGVYFIFAARKIDGLLPTIKSRAVHIQIHNPNIQECIKSYSHSYTEDEIKRAFALTGGAVYAMEEILTGSDSEAITLAKDIVSSKKIKRLEYVDKLVKDREATLTTLDVIIRIYDSLLRSPQTMTDIKKVASYNEKLELCTQTYAAIKANGNNKLALTRLFMNI